jgi:hypothetical protein
MYGNFFGVPFATAYSSGSIDFVLKDDVVYISFDSPDIETGHYDHITAKFTKEEFAKLLSDFRKEGFATLESSHQRSNYIKIKRRPNNAVEIEVSGDGGFFVFILCEIPLSVFKLFDIE